MRFIGHILAVVNWFDARYASYKRAHNERAAAFLNRVPVASQYEVLENNLAAIQPDGRKLIFPSAVLWSASLIDSIFISPFINILQTLKVWHTDAQFRQVTERPGVFLIWLLSTALYTVLNGILSILSALTGHTRSWVNIFDDSFDIQYCVKDLQPVYTPQGARYPFCEALMTPDLLYPFDRHYNAGHPPVVTPLDVVMSFFGKLGYEEQPQVLDVAASWGLNSGLVSDCVYDSRQAELPGEFGNVTFQSRAIIFCYKQAVVVCFRGTYPTAVVQWLTDFAAEQLSYPGQRDNTDPALAVRCHRGFFTALGLPAAGDSNGNYPETLFTQIVRKLNEPPYRDAQHIYICGHSLGAALATMFSFAVASPLTIAPWEKVRTEQKRGPTMTAASSSMPATSTARRFRVYNAKTKETGQMDVKERTSPPSSIQQAVRAGENSAIGSGPPTTSQRRETPGHLLTPWVLAVKEKVRGVYTYGSPRVGNDQFANAFDDLFKYIPVHRWVNDGDIIAHLPPPISDGATPPPGAGLAFDYAHVDGLRWVDGDQRVPHVINQDVPRRPWLKLNLFDHNPGDYVRHINGALNSQIQNVYTIKLQNRLHGR
jgi:hypothetical protein